jgi:hypothetical protein
LLLLAADLVTSGVWLRVLWEGPMLVVAGEKERSVELSPRLTDTAGVDLAALMDAILSCSSLIERLSQSLS